jgi:hypothetical protein
LFSIFLFRYPIFVSVRIKQERIDYRQAHNELFIFFIILSGQINKADHALPPARSHSYIDKLIYLQVFSLKNTLT